MTPTYFEIYERELYREKDRPMHALEHEREALCKVVEAVIEQCAQVCDRNLADDPIGKFGVQECADAIRALKGTR